MLVHEFDSSKPIQGQIGEAMLRTQFLRGMKFMQEETYELSKSKGFYDGENPDERQLLLVHSEISEAVEALREGNPPSDKNSKFTSEEMELADAVIRLLNYAQHKGYHLGEAIVAKHMINVDRPYKHGKKY